MVLFRLSHTCLTLGILLLTTVGRTQSQGSLSFANNAFASTSRNYVIPAEFTLAIWFRTGVASGRLIGFGDSQTDWSRLYDRHVYIGRGGQVYYGVFAGQGTVIRTQGSYNDGRWHHVAAVQSKSGISLYLDGKLAASGPPANPTVPYAGFLRVGCDNLAGWSDVPASWCLQGAVDEASFWNTALSGERITYLSQYKLQGNEDDLIGCWRFDEGKGITSRDVARGNDMTIYGGTWTSENAPVRTPMPDIRIEAPDARLTIGKPEKIRIVIQNRGIAEARNIVCRMVGQHPSLRVSITQPPAIKSLGPGGAETLSFLVEVEEESDPGTYYFRVVHSHEGSSSVNSAFSVEVSLPYQRGLPPSLSAQLAFRDANGNGILEAGESAVLRLTLTNQGRGDARGLKITLHDDQNDNSLSVGSGFVKELGVSKPATVEIPIKAGLETRTREHRFAINVTERFGYDMDLVYLILQTREYARPSLTFSGLEIVDSGEGTMAIVEDGQLQAGEQARVRVVVQNVGEGTAEQVKYQVECSDPNIYLSSETGELGNMQAGQVKAFFFTVSPNKRVEGGKRLPVYLTVTESVGKGNLAYYPLPIQLDQRPPKVETVTIKPDLESLKKQIARFEFTTKKFTANVGSLIDVKAVAVAKTKRRNSVGVIFRVENYQELPSAPYASNDAELMKEYLEKRLGVERVVLYKNNEVSGFVFDNVFNPDNGELQRAIVKGETDLFVYYSGHGLPNKSGEETYLFPADGKVSRLDVQGYSLTRFYESLSKLGAKSVTVILDACFSGGSRATTKTKTENLVAMKGISLKINKPWLLYRNFTVINSSTGEETSLGYDDAQTGLFTYYLAAGLQGKADANEDGKITLGELKEYVTTNVMETSRKLSGLQTPEFYGDDNRVLVQY